MKHKYRFYISPENIQADTAVISLPEYHHMINVLRYKTGDLVCFFDGRGKEYDGKIISVDPVNKKVRINVLAECEDTPLRQLTLAQGMIKSGNMDMVIRQATELGVTSIYPLKTKNSVVKLEGKTETAKIDKWRRISEEACKQCGRALLPSIEKIYTPEEAMKSLDASEVKLLLTVSKDAKSLHDIPDNKTGSVSVMIGPEADFTEGEVATAVSHGWTPVYLGGVIMRSETAAAAALGAVCHKFRFWI